MATSNRRKKPETAEDATILEVPTTAPKATAPVAPNGELMLKAAEGMLSVAQSFIIDSPIMYEAAGEELKAIKGKMKQLDEQRKSITRKMDEAKKQVMELFKPALDRLTMAESCIKEALAHWDEEQRKRAAAAQKILDDHARAERERAEQIAAEKAAEANAEAARAAELEQAGDVEAAAKAKENAAAAAMVATTLKSSATVMIAPTVKANTPEVSGIRHTSTWKATVTDKRALLAHILAESDKHPEMLDWVEINMAPLHDMARALKQATRLPGVSVAEESGIAAASL